MALAVNHNLMANNVANSLNQHYSNLATSTERLATGLRINSAADDAAGLAIRELMRADISSLQQGIRNTNDAISMIQTADAALAIIDEKLTRMKELAEQAATGTYDSTQRLMISSEFLQMASEIDRIANATDFNGIHLLNGNLQGKHNGSRLTSTGAMKVHFGSGNDSAEDYYYVEIPSATVNSLFEQGLDSDTIIITETKTITENLVIPALTTGLQEAQIVEDPNGSGDYIFELTITDKVAGQEDNAWLPGLDRYYLPSGLRDITIESKNAGTYAHKPHVNLFGKDGKQLTGYKLDNQDSSIWWNGLTADEIFAYNQAFDDGASLNTDLLVNTTADGASHDGSTTYRHSGVSSNLTLQITQDQNEYNTLEVMTIDKIDNGDNELVFMIGGHDTGYCNKYNLHITAKISALDVDTIRDKIKSTTILKEAKTIPNATYTVEIEHYVPVMNLETQDRAQRMLTKIDNAIVNKDNIRAKLGALQNRFENTITNLTTQAENLQAAESRISDVDVATEMTQFVRNQILTQSAVAMLSQANSLPQMAMQLIG